jgi:hypothetical protein
MTIRKSLCYLIIFPSVPDFRKPFLELLLKTNRRYVFWILNLVINISYERAASVFKGILLYVQCHNRQSHRQ